MSNAAMTIEVDCDQLGSYTDWHLATLWRVAQNPYQAGAVERIGREIARRWLDTIQPAGPAAVTPRVRDGRREQRLGQLWAARPGQHVSKRDVMRLLAIPSSSTAHPLMRAHNARVEGRTGWTPVHPLDRYDF